jgi:hypothetical protein
MTFCPTWKMPHFSPDWGSQIEIPNQDLWWGLVWDLRNQVLKWGFNWDVKTIILFHHGNCPKGRWHSAPLEKCPTSLPIEVPIRDPQIRTYNEVSFEISETRSYNEFPYWDLKKSVVLFHHGTVWVDDVLPQLKIPLNFGEPFFRVRKIFQAKNLIIYQAEWQSAWAVPTRNLSAGVLQGISVFHVHFPQIKDT